MSREKTFYVVLCIFSFLYFIDTFSTFFLSFNSSGIFGEYNPVWSHVLKISPFLFVFLKLILLFIFDIVILIHGKRSIIYTITLLSVVSFWYLFAVVLQGICWFYVLV